MGFWKGAEGGRGRRRNKERGREKNEIIEISRIFVFGGSGAIFSRCSIYNFIKMMLIVSSTPSFSYFNCHYKYSQISEEKNEP